MKMVSGKAIAEPMNRKIRFDLRQMLVVGGRNISVAQ